MGIDDLGHRANTGESLNHSSSEEEDDDEGYQDGQGVRESNGTFQYADDSLNSSLQSALSGVGGGRAGSLFSRGRVLSPALSVSTSEREVLDESVGSL